MKRYVYVQVEIDPSNDLPCSFSHCFLMSSDDEDAYLKGYRHFKKHPSRISKQGYRFLNDYVVEIRSGRKS